MHVDLHRAVMHNDLAGAAVAINTGADVNGVVFGATPLLVAVMKRVCVEILTLLLESGADPNIPDDRGFTPLTWACFCNDEQDARLLIGRGAAIDTKDTEGSTPLHRAVGLGHLNIVKLLIECGANVNNINKYGIMPVALASAKGFPVIVELLRQAGAISPERARAFITIPSSGREGDDAGRAADRADIRPPERQTSVARPEGLSPSTTRCKLRSDGTAPGSLHQAIIDRDFGKMASAIAAGADANNKNENGSTPLLLATMRRAIEIDVVRFLLDHGADPNIGGAHGFTPLIWACEYGNEDLARLLVRSGAIVDAKSVDGSTALHRAVARGHMNIVRLLVERGADINNANNNGVMPVALADAKGNRDIVVLLLQMGALPPETAKGLLRISAVKP